MDPSPSKPSATPAPPPSAQSSSSAAGGAGDADKPKPKEACVACRTTKVKCRLATPDSAPSDVCARCTRLKIPCVYAQARRGRKPGSKRTLTTTVDKNDASSSNSSEQPRKILKMSSSSASPELRPSSSRADQLSGPSQTQPLPPQHFPSPSSQQTNTFPFHSFEQPAAQTAPSTMAESSYQRGPLMQQRGPSSSNGQQSWQPNQNLQPPRRDSNQGYPLPVASTSQWASQGGQSQNPPTQAAQRYFPTPVYPSYESEQRSGPSSSTFHTSFPPPFYAANTHQRRPSEPNQFQPHAASSGQPPPSSSYYSPYPPSGPQSSYNPPSQPRSEDVKPEPSSLSSDRRSSAQLHQESFLRGPPPPAPSYPPPLNHLHHLPPLAPPPTDHPSAASTTNASEVSASSRKSLPGVLSIRGLLADVEEMSQSRPVEERELPRPPLTMAEVLDQKSGIGPTTNTAAPTSGIPIVTETSNGFAMGGSGKGARWEDPLSLGLVTPEEVVVLFDCFHSRLNLLIDILDVALHTPTYTRSTSSILFTAVLCVASKIAKPDIYPTLLALCNQQLGRAFAEGVSEIGLIQALSMLAFWKETSERGSWRRVGYGIRLGIELGLHLEPKRPLPEDELEARKVLDRERCWFQLVCFDHVLAEQHSRPLMILKEFRWDAEVWALDHPEYPCHCDAMLASSLALVKVRDMVEKTRRCQDDSAQLMLMTMSKTEISKFKDKWLGANPIVKWHPDCLAMIRFYVALFQFEVDVLQLEIASSGAQPDLTQMQPQTSARGTFSGFETASPGSEQVVAFSNVISSALAALRILVTDLPSFLCYAQDAVTFGSATVALWLVKNIARMPPLAKDAVYDSLRQATLVCRSVTTDPRDTSAYQARFFASLIHVAAASRAASLASKPPSPSANGREQTQPSLSLPNAPLSEPPVPRRGSDQNVGLFDVYQANDAAGVDLGALDEQLEGGQMGWPFPSELGEDQNVDLDEMFADLSAWFPSTHGEPSVATSGWATGQGLPGIGGGGVPNYLESSGGGNGWNGGGGSGQMGQA